MSPIHMYLIGHARDHSLQHEVFNDVCYIPDVFASDIASMDSGLAWEI
jgi:hypothetical protein